MQHGTVRYQVIGALVVLAALVIAVPVLMSLREEPTAPVHSIELPQEPDTGMAARVDDAGNTPPGTLPELSDIPLPAAPPAPDLEPIPPAPPPTIPGAGAPAAPAPPAASAQVAPPPAPPAAASPAPAPTPAAPSTRPTPPPSGPVASAMPAPRPAPTAPAVGAQAYIVQLGTFVNRDGAQAVHDRLRGAGFRVFTEETLVNGKTALRVRVGPELDRSAAEKQRERIARELGLEGVVLRYQ